jgi:CRP/FNR family cyclic AMP-dependent transcriptional regulator
MQTLLDACRSLPLLELAAGDVLISEGQPRTALYVLASGTLEVSFQGATVAAISEPGSVIGEIAFLLDLNHGAAVSAAHPSQVYVVSDVEDFLAADHHRVFEIARTLALRLNRLTAYVADVRAQYAHAGGHLELLNEVLAELTFGTEPIANPGSARDPDPLY